MNQESCVINGGHTTKYFRFERRARQGDPISAYLFILALEILFIFIKWDNKKVRTKQNTLRNNYKDGALKSVDIEDKMTSLNVLGSNSYTLKIFMSGKLFLCNI